MTLSEEIMLDEASGVRLSHLQLADKESLVALLQDPLIHKHTLVIPNPYKLDDAEWFINLNLEHRKKAREAGRPSLYWCIRDASSSVVGMISLERLSTTKTFEHILELGYYLSADLRGKGIMPKAVRVLCRIGFESWGARRIQAGIFSFNKASGRVLQKSGFQFEATLRKYYSKPGVEELIDCNLYALIKEDWKETDL
ncbi:hypothetical protein HK101_007432 [Irineochytrium annulatum]|nr:hypothetical protein HK101_007432 [Irineochytrium annulatum]